MEHDIAQTAYAKHRPILIGAAAAVVTLAAGIALAFATGIATPFMAKAFDVLPPCCTDVLPPVVDVPPPPPPVIVPDSPWADLVQMLWSSNEFHFID